MEVLIQILKSKIWLGNTAYEYAVGLFIAVSVAVLLKIFQLIILRRLRVVAKKTKTDLDDILIEIFSGLRPPFYFLISVYIGLKTLLLSETADRIVDAVFLFALAYEVIRASDKLVNYLVNKYIEKSGGEGKAMARAIAIITKIILWAVGLAFILSNIGVNVTSFIASMGIGGIAVALALQNVLSDLFSSFSIYIDKPFQVGDYIVIGADKGTVEKIGMKTTRVRSLQGEELVVSNKELTSVRVQNFKKMQKRRVLFKIGVVYGTPHEKLKEIPSIIEKIIKSHKSVSFERCHFESYGDFSLNFEIVYFVNSPEYLTNMNIKQSIHLAIYKSFEKEKIEFAYPTQTIFVEKN